MRDPARIDVILELIRKVWTQCPDLRLTQLIVNLVPRKDSCPEVFYYEDDRLIDRLIEELRRITNAP